MKSALTPLLALALLSMSAATSLAATADTPQEQARTEYQLMLEEAERARQEAESARREAGRAAERARETMRQRAAMEREAAENRRVNSEELARERALHEDEMEAAREELSRAHRELREASREVANAHRELARANAPQREVRVINLGERPVIGVVLGSQVDQGIQITGVSPDGPADKAGVRTGDILVAINDANLARDGGAGRDAVFDVMADSEPGEDLPLTIMRGDEVRNLVVKPELREPRSWQSLVRIAETESGLGWPDGRSIHIERIEVPDIDEDAIAAQAEALRETLEARSFVFVSPDGEDFELDSYFDIEFDSYSDVAGHAMREANVWFGFPHTRGLELATVNPELGDYFKTDRGVLVIKARDDNAYQLRSGDVILNVDATDVDTPADLVRALREIDSGDEIEIRIKRERRTVTLKVVMPENRFGLR